MKFLDRKSSQLFTIVMIIVFGALGGCSSGGGSDDDDDDVSVVVPRLADVIIVIDSSGSMAAEIGFVQTLINNFVAAVRAEGIDLRVIVVADGAQFCAPAPLGSGSCVSDENLPGYRHDTTSVVTNDIFAKIISTYPNWNSSLRSGAIQAIIAVSDADDTMWETFDAALLALDPPAFDGYQFHAFTPQSLCPGFAGAVGTEYIELAADKGGTIHDLCDQIFDPGFNSIAGDIAAGLAVD